MPSPALINRKIPVRLMNRPSARASVIGNCASWHCPCGNPVALHGRSGGVAGPTRESVIVCPQCSRVYFVIPMDRSGGAPIEVAELFGVPEAATETPIDAGETPSLG